MDNPSAPPGKAHKYARVERERRWLMRQPPAVADAVAEVEINDLYVTNSRLRVRRIDDRRGMFTAVYKLTQKVPGSESSALITNTYLCDAEYETLAGLPGDRIHKIRYSVPPIGIDAFLDALEGLVMAEAEFDSDEEMAAFGSPDGAVAEVTGDSEFTGGWLARTTRPELARRLLPFGLRLREGA